MAGLVSSDRIGPGEFAYVTVTLDPTGKAGPMTKEVRVFSNDSNNPTATAHLTAHVDHALDIEPGKPMEDVLFGQSDCASCHADPAEDLTGGDLYRAVCEMCHGTLREYAASLPKAIRNRGAILRWIADGKGERGMPGYSAEKGGPLSREQIDTLVQSILDVRESPQ